MKSLTALLAVVGALCLFEATVVAAAAQDPTVPASAAGAAVGHQVKSLIVKGSGQNEPRSVKVHLWYPGDRRGFSDASQTVYKSRLHGRPLIPQLAPLAWKVEAQIARETDAIDSRGKPFPVIVFSHGSTNDPIDYAHTLELIAAEGFVVAAPYHVNNTQDDARTDFINTEMLKRVPGTPRIPCQDTLAEPCSRTDVPRSMRDRVRDIGRILDELPDWFGERVDMSRVGVLGHSRGTVTALAAAGGSSIWGIAPEPRVKAIMGMAIGVRNLTLGASLANVTVPALLVAGGRDQNSAPSVSVEAFGAINSPEKAFVTIPNATHRTFDSTYCAQLQSAGASVLAAGRDEQNNPRALLDLHTVGLIAASPISGKAVHYCARSFFTSPVNIEQVVAATSNAEYACIGATCGIAPAVAPVPTPCITTSIPCTGLETEEVKRGVTEIAVTFFGTVLKRSGDDGIHFTRYLAPKWLLEHVPMVGAARAQGTADDICPPGQDVDCDP